MSILQRILNHVGGACLNFMEKPFMGGSKTTKFVEDFSLEYSHYIVCCKLRWHGIILLLTFVGEERTLSIRDIELACSWFHWRPRWKRTRWRRYHSRDFILLHCPTWPARATPANPRHTLCGVMNVCVLSHACMPVRINISVVATDN